MLAWCVYIANQKPELSILDFKNVPTISGADVPVQAVVTRRPLLNPPTSAEVL